MAVISEGRLKGCIGVSQMKRNRRKIPVRMNQKYEYLETELRESETGK